MPAHGPRSLDSDKPIHLAELKRGTPGITGSVGASFGEAATVCLEEARHAPGIKLTVMGDFSCSYPICWDACTAQMRRSWADLQDATEFGACGVAALLVPRLTGLTVVRRSVKGTGFDYWLGYEDDEDSLFQGKARMEVSGILEGSESKMNARVRSKRAQVAAAGSQLEALIVVVEFGEPRSAVVKT
jgi:hypothetical protein